MAVPRCGACKLPLLIHFCHCRESELYGPTPRDKLRPRAIIFEPRELRIRPLAEWIAKHPSKK